MKNRKINFIKLGILLFGISITLWNCVEEQFVENEPETPIQINAKTVSFKDAIVHFNAKKEKIKLKRTYAKGTKEPIEVTPDWNTLEFNDIAYTDANLTTANAEINRDGKYFSQLYSTKYHKKAGYNTRIHSTVNGKNILISYFHLQENNRILQTSNPLTYVKAGDIIGYQGDSGNLKGAIKKKTVDSHVYIEVRELDGGNSWGYSHYQLVDPRDYLSTTIDDNGVSQANTNCN